MSQLGLDRLRQASIGLDGLFNFASALADQAQPFPPYNVFKVDENTHVIEMAVAGYTKNDIEVTADNEGLQITGNKSKSEVTGQVIWKGISNKSFTRSFRLGNNIVVKSASMADGILTITLEREPTKKANVIAIS